MIIKGLRVLAAATHVKVGDLLAELGDDAVNIICSTSASCCAAARPCSSDGRRCCATPNPAMMVETANGFAVELNLYATYPARRSVRLPERERSR